MIARAASSHALRPRPLRHVDRRRRRTSPDRAARRSRRSRRGRLPPAGSRPPRRPSRRRACTVSRPRLPVKALALPELTRSARAFPPASAVLHQSTGAEGHFERVKTPATSVPLSKTARRTSVRFLYLMPASAVAKRTPAIGGKLGIAPSARAARRRSLRRLSRRRRSAPARRRRRPGRRRRGGRGSAPAAASGTISILAAARSVVDLLGRRSRGRAAGWMRSACGLEGRRRLLALLLELDDVPAELGSGPASWCTRRHRARRPRPRTASPSALARRSRGRRPTGPSRDPATSPWRSWRSRRPCRARR